MDRKKLDLLFLKMIGFYHGEAKRIAHFTKVHSYAALIGREEGMKEEELQILEAAAYVHDIGIKAAEEKYNSSNGKYQEELGPAPAGVLMEECGFGEAETERVKYLVAHHHTYKDMKGLDYQILVEADFLVNLEEHMGAEAVPNVYQRIFRTECGRKLCRELFGLEEA